MTVEYSPPAPESELPPSYDAAAFQQLTSPAAPLETSAASPSVQPLTDKKSRPAASDDPLFKRSDADAHSLPPAFSVHNPDVYTGGRRKKLTDAVSQGHSQTDLFSEPADVLTHDAQLNKDGEALYRFLLRAALTPPKVTVHIKGWHEEYREHSFQTHHHHGDRRNDRHHSRHSRRDDQHKVPVVDFDFNIALTPLLQLSIDEGHRVLPDSRYSPIRHPVLHNPTLFVKRDEDLAYRGRMLQEVLSRPDAYLGAKMRRRSQIVAQDTSNDAVNPLLGPGSWSPAELEAATYTLDLVRPNRKSRKELRQRAKESWLPWSSGVETRADLDNGFLLRPKYDQGVATERVNLDVDDSHEETSALDTAQSTAEVKVRPADGQSLMTVRTACDIYTDDKKELRQFRVKKIVAGWNMTSFEDAIRKIVEEVYPTAYANDRNIEVDVKVEDDLITVMPDSNLARFITTLQRTTHLTRFLVCMALFLTGTFLIVLPVVGILLYFKGSRYNTVGIVWQLSQWEVAGDATDDEGSVNARLMRKERESAARAGAPWALNNRTDPYHSDETPGTVAGSSASTSKPSGRSEYGEYISSDGVIQQQPFVLASTHNLVLAHRGVRQGDVVKAWEGRIRASVANHLIQNGSQPLGQSLSDHLPRPDRRIVDPLSGHERREAPIRLV